MRQTVLVTVQGTRRRLDVELPGDVPLNDLIPLLQEMCNHSTRFAANNGLARTPWALYVAHLDQPLKTTQTLLEAGVFDGDVLLLQPRNAAPNRKATSGKKGVAQTIEASEQTGMIGVEWKKGWLL